MQFFPGKSHGQKGLEGYDPLGPTLIVHDLATKPLPPINCLGRPNEILLKKEMYKNKKQNPLHPDSCLYYSFVGSDSILGHLHSWGANGVLQSLPCNFQFLVLGRFVQRCLPPCRSSLSDILTSMDKMLIIIITTTVNVAELSWWPSG